MEMCFLVECRAFAVVVVVALLIYAAADAFIGAAEREEFGEDWKDVGD